MDRISQGMVAGFIATLAVSVLIWAKQVLGLLPGFDMIALLGGLVGEPENPAVGWVTHFLMGTVAWGVLFAALEPYFSGAYWKRGVVLSLGAWLIMMVTLLPVAGLGLFGMDVGIGVPLLTLVLHVLFGAVLGDTYRRLIETELLGVR